jgi:predicted ATPase
VWTGAVSDGEERAGGGPVAGGPIGREAEASRLSGLLVESRLVTVAGCVGVGKSCLAAFVTGTTRGDWDRVLRVRRHGARPGPPGALTNAVLHAATGRGPRPGSAESSVLDDVVRALRRGRPLLFLDDVDPVHREGVGLVQALLHAVPQLRVLVTSRRPLGLGDERVLRLAPLSTVPVAGREGPPPAVELFLDRARAAREGFTVADGDLDAVTAVCRSVDGLPLAVELAAAQMACSDPQDLADLLRHHQCWLTSRRVALPRHRSLRRAVASAYVLCDREERVVWARTSVFAGSFDASAAAFVCAGGSVAAHEVPACLAELAATGVLQPVGDPGGMGEPRYRMAPAARDFGTERLEQAGELAVAKDRHAMHGRRVAATAEFLWNSGRQPQAVQLVQEERDNLVAMLDHVPHQIDQAAPLLEAVVNLWFWWTVYGCAEEGRRYLELLLPLCHEEHPAVVRGMWLEAWLTAGRDPRAACELLHHAWTAAVMAGDDATVGRVAHVQGVLAMHQGDPAAAAEHFQEAVRAVPAQAPAGPSTAVSLAALAVAQSGEAPDAARHTARRALTQSGVRIDTWACIVARYALALADHQEGRKGRALRRARRTLASLDRHWPAPHGTTAALEQLIADIEAGRPARARLCPDSPTGVAVPLPRLISRLPCP